jgi:Tol biopolymer transport system component
MRHSLAVLFFLLGCRSGGSSTATPVLFLDSVPGKADLVDYEPAWSPSGTHLAFISNRNGPLKVYTAKADGTELTRLTHGPDEDDSPSWSPDGKQIAFVSTRDGNPEIYRMNADGSDQTRLTDDPGMDIHPVWAPDGNSIVWNSSRHSVGATETFEVFAMDPDGRLLQQLTHSGIATYASWSPDGRQLLFRRQVSDSNSEIFVSQSAGDDVNLTRDPAFDGWPSWAADGRRVIFAREKEGEASIYVVKTDGSGLSPLVTLPGRWTNPRWSPKGDRVVASRRWKGEMRLYLFPAPPS